MTHSLKRYSLGNKQMQVTLCNFGARILSIKVLGAGNKWIETTQNHSEDQDIINDDSFMGTTVGRVCNRISNASFKVENQIYKLEANEGQNNLHSGPKGFDKYYWKTNGCNEQLNQITFEITSEDGDQGFPGQLKVKVSYELTDDNELIISYFAQTDKATPINLCNHAYFTLGESSIKDMSIQINADQYLPVDEQSIPLGHFENVRGSKFDLRAICSLSEVLDDDGYDHCYKINQSVAARVIAHNTGISLEVETDHLGVQFYSGNFLPIKQSALCLEAQGFPDAINHADIPDDILQAGQQYNRRVIYRYDLKK